MTAEEIKQSVTMGDVLARYGIKVNRNGMCCCPIHGEKHPSMKVYKDGYKCFACNSAGDVFSFVMAYEGVDFKTAFATLGGTYERQPNKTARIVRNKKFERRKTHGDRHVCRCTDEKSSGGRHRSPLYRLYLPCDPSSGGKERREDKVEKRKKEEDYERPEKQFI